MIKSIEIENFRSIRSDSITLEPLTVLIGANGSGKSNLVKALEFISTLPTQGLELAVSRQGGREAMVSKDIPTGAIKSSPTRIKYEITLTKPDPDIAGPDEIPVTHDLTIQFLSANRIKVLKEDISFSNVLYVGEVLRKRASDEDPEISNEDISELVQSKFQISRKARTTKHIQEPELSGSNIPIYLAWLGFPNFDDKISRPSELKEFLKKFERGRNRTLAGKASDDRISSSGLFTDPDIATICDFSPQFQIFRSAVASIKRYDLLLNELRREQAPGDSPELTKVGGNMPSALRNISLHKEAFGRLLDSFETIAPHILKMESTSLRTGKEFVEFMESSSGRGIETWESSDGSLRALAILMALESAEDGDTVIIEEPEQNLHPWAVRTLVDHIRTIVEIKDLQIILTTHSEHVLEKISAKELRVVTRDQEHGTKFKRLDQIIPNGDVDMGDIGRLWVKGLLGGVPGE